MSPHSSCHHLRSATIWISTPSQSSNQIWIQNLLKNAPKKLARKLASRHCPGTPATASWRSNGAFNICYRVTFDNGRRVLVRFTTIGRVVARKQKVEDEVAIMQYVAQHTVIPVPKVLGFGKCAVGPYIFMDYIEVGLLNGCLRDPSREIATLRPILHMSVLRRAYFGMAEVLLKLSHWSYEAGRNRRVDRVKATTHLQYESICPVR